MSDEIKDNILSPSQWLRILFMLIFILIAWVVGIGVFCIMIGQALFNLVTGKGNENLSQAAEIAVEYFSQIIRFLTYCSDNKPFPFSPLPSADKSSKAVEEAVVEASVQEPVVGADKEPSVDEEPATTDVEEPSSSEDDVFSDISFTTPNDDDSSEDKKKPSESE